MQYSSISTLPFKIQKYFYFVFYENKVLIEKIQTTTESLMIVTYNSLFGTSLA